MEMEVNDPVEPSVEETLDHVYTLLLKVDERLQKIERLVEQVAEHAGPIIAEVASSPMFRMLTAGKGK